jgi:hypothetical protein
MFQTPRAYWLRQVSGEADQLHFGDGVLARRRSFLDDAGQQASVHSVILDHTKPVNRARTRLSASFEKRGNLSGPT